MKEKIEQVRLLSLILLLLTTFLINTIPSSFSTPSKSFYKLNSEVYDDWSLCRTRAYGEDGFFQVSERSFRPAIVFESISNYKDTAWMLGKKFAEKYKDKHKLAEAIFYYVRDRIKYTPDKEQFGLDEFAQNADELAKILASKGVAYGDCEDYAAILAVMYKAAGFRSAIVLAPGHAATLVYLPDYERANVMWKLGGEEGWIWVEATGRNNPFGQTPSNYIGKKLLAYEVKDEVIILKKPPEKVKEVSIKGEGATYLNYSPFFLMLLFMWIFRMIGGMIMVKRKRY